MAEQVCEVGSLPVRECYDLLCSSKDAVLIDVRCSPEWTFVGAPSLENLGKQALFAEWQQFPLTERTHDFVDRLSEALLIRRIPKSAPLLFICRSGARSLAAARAMAAHGYSQCINVAGGFEGPRDAAGHRGTIEGWKAAGLPWKQG